MKVKRLTIKNMSLKTLFIMYPKAPSAYGLIIRSITINIIANATHITIPENFLLLLTSELSIFSPHAWKL
jgi:hypothetical protein